VPVCQTDLSRIINTVQCILKLSLAQSDHNLKAANCAKKKISRPGQKLFTCIHTYSAASLDKISGKSQSSFLLLSNNEHHGKPESGTSMINSNSMEKWPLNI